ncbi:MAG: methylmalonyl-CoA mutase family protein, partial [Thermodesulfobacteriota bacterium]
MGVRRYIKNEKDEVKDIVLQSGIHVKPLYTQKDLEEIGFDPAKDLAPPGEYPFTRGIHP